MFKKLTAEEVEWSFAVIGSKGFWINQVEEAEMAPSEKLIAIREQSEDIAEEIRKLERHYAAEAMENGGKK